MKTQWIVVANASQARFFKQDSASGPLIAVTSMAHPASRLKGSELANDRPGHEATDNSPGGNRFEPRSDPRRREHRRFAREVADRLDDALGAGEFSSLWICASDPFLGELKPELSEAVRHRLERTTDSDFTSLDIGEIERRLQQLQ
jgi:protein required for attachment to host cells